MDVEEKKYLNREIDQKFDDVHEKLDKILDQTIKTNGRVNNLESWKSFIQGGLAILTVLLIPILLLLIQLKYEK